MGKVLRQRLRQARFESPVHEAVLNVIVASGHVRERLERVCQEHGISATQFNVLRILRGAQPGGLARCEIVPRLLDRAPDVTRLIDRLAAAGHVERARSGQDGRQSIARITRRGLALLERMDGAMRRASGVFEQRLNPHEAEQLSMLLEKLYEEDL